MSEHIVVAGFMPLFDSAVLVTAREMGFAAREGIDLRLSRETSWANIRDRIAIGHFDVAHMLGPMPLACNLGLTPLASDTIVPFSLGLGGNCVTVSNAVWDSMAAHGARADLDPSRNGAALREMIRASAHDGNSPLRFAVTHPHSGHNYELRYWLASCGISPAREIEIVIVPPPFMADALAAGRYGKEVSDEEVRAVMAQEVEKVLTPVALPLELDLSHKPHVVLVVGVNGTGKTTTIGKLAAKLTAGGLKVTLAAGDTFRAAAIEQLKIWGERTGSEVVSSKLGADAAGLAFDAYEKAKANGSDVLVIDTAGRLQNKAELMAELEKIVRVLGKHDPEAPHTVLQTVDATTGQNALNQVEIFRNVAGVNGLVMTKLDGTARGGILVAIAARHRLPVYFIGVGEGIDDLEPFAAQDFAKAIAGVN